ncbi:MAG TPA: site-specific integrase [Granulicella sp.]
MANRRVTLVIYAKTASGWKRYPAVVGNNGKMRPGFGKVGGKLVSFENYRYELRRYEGRKMFYTPAGTDAAAAYVAQKLEQAKSKARVVAQHAGVPVVGAEDDRPIRAEITRFLQSKKDEGALEAAQVYGVALEDFIAATKITSTGQITPDLMKRFHAELRRKGNGDRTVHNKHNHVKAFVSWLGLDAKKTVGRAPRYEKKVVKVYQPDQISSLKGENASSVNPQIDAEKMGVMLDVLRMAGLRDQEAAFLQWPDIDLKAGLIRVRSKPKLGFKIKDKEQRDVAIPKALVKVITAWKRRKPDVRFVLGTENDMPNRRMLRSVKRLAKRAGMNCGRCDGCLSKHQECREFTLHAFRRTYATSLAERGVPIRTIMQQLGHSDMATVLKYLGHMETAKTKVLLDQRPW